MITLTARALAIGWSRLSAIPVAEKVVTFWVQKWEESERGWGTRPDGFTLHASRAHVDEFLEARRARETAGKSPDYVPDEYSRPDGLPYEWDCTDAAVIERVEASKFGCWGEGRNPPKPKPGVEPGGWRPVDGSR